MAISFILNDEAVNDQTTALQTSDSGDGFTDTDVAYAPLPATFRTFVETTLGLSNAFPTAVGVATKTDSVTVSASAGSQLTGIVFTDGSGGPLDGDDSGLKTVDGKSILLFASGDNTVIGRYDSDGNGSADAVAFVIFKDDNLNATNTQAQVAFHVVTIVPIQHPDNTDPDDAVNLGNTLKLAASEKISFSFGGTPSGNHLFTMVQSGTSGLIATPETEVIKLHISQGGGPTTLGVFNQMIDPTETMVFTFVTNPNAGTTVPNLSQGEADLETNIAFSDVRTITGGSVTISQTQGNDPAGMKLTALNTKSDGSATEPSGDGFINGYTNDSIAAISEVRVFNGSGTLLLTATGDVTTPVNGITVDFLASGEVELRGLEDNYVIEYDATSHERLRVTGLEGKFDIGGIGISSTAAASEFVGQQIVIEDDEPTVNANATALLDDDALTGGNPNGTGDDVDSADVAGTLGFAFGTDGAGSIAFLTTGAPSGFSYELSGDDLLIKQGTTTVMTVTLDTATGGYTVTQNNPILHAAGLDENNQAFTVSYRVTDGDGDTADGTLGINADDDTPTVSANATALLDDDALTGGNPNGTGDDVDSADVAGTLGHSFGADSAGASIAFLTTGAPSGFSYELSGDDLLIKQGATTVMTVTLDTATGGYTVTQNNPILHAAGLDENNQAFTVSYRVTDGDGDTADGTLGINADDDTPTVSANATALLDDDALTGGNPNGTGDDVDSADVAGTLGHSFGADSAGASIAFLTTGAPSGFSYELSGDDLLIKQGATTVMTVTLDTATGGYTVTQNNPILHAAGLDENNQAFTVSYRVTDGDGDTADGTLGINADDDTPTVSANATALLDDDALTGGNPNGTGDDVDSADVAGTLGHSFGADSAGASIAFLTTGAPSGFSYELSGDDLLIKQGATTVMTVTLDTATGGYTVTQNNPILHAAGLDENNQAFTVSYRVTDGDGDTADGTLGINADDDTPTIGPIANSIVDFAVGSNATKSLVGLPGADDNSTYTITDFEPPFVVNGVTVNGVLSADSGTVSYFGDDDGVPGVSAGDTVYYTLALDQTDPGGYTFMVHVDPVPADLVFSFAGTPSGNHLFTMVSADGSGLIATPETEVIKLHISQGGGPTTLGVFNQMIDPTETMVFTFVNGPNAGTTVPNLSQGEADLETNIQFTDVKTITSGEVSISQTQGNDPAGMKLTALNTKGDGSATEPSGDGFINGYANDPIAAISEVRIFDDTGTLLLTATGDVPNPVNGITVDFLASGEVEIRGLEDNYVIEYDAASHERLKVTGLEGKFDIGGISTSQSQPTPDQKLDFTVQISDNDGDLASASFSIGIDGTGIFDDGTVLGV